MDGDIELPVIAAGVLKADGSTNVRGMRGIRQGVGTWQIILNDGAAEGAYTCQVTPMHLGGGGVVALCTLVSGGTPTIKTINVMDTTGASVDTDLSVEFKRIVPLS